LITTNSITTPQNRVVISRAQNEGARIGWAIHDHPWVAETDGAAVRVAMTVLTSREGVSRRVLVDHAGQVASIRVASSLNSDLSIGTDVPTAAGIPLLANCSLAAVGFGLYGSGFILSPEERAATGYSGEELAEVIFPYLRARELSRRPEG